MFHYPINCSYSHTYTSKRRKKRKVKNQERAEIISEEPKKGSCILGDKALLKKITETRENKEVYKFWTRSKTNLLKGKWLPF